ncbi:NADP-dependent oxidoreductase [Nocardia sp. CA-128927]|uniref:NADP-dependent oxidoreductase n=1 Tax=Nocardia sp. CA-128927 TaxID=3239975 RepID=UPI003D97DE42
MLSNRLGTGVERSEDRVAVRPHPLGQYVDRIDQRRSERVSSYSTRGGTSAYASRRTSPCDSSRRSVWVSILREMPPISSISSPWRTGPLHLARKPASLSHVEAAALPVVGLTAWQGLVDLGGVTAGDRVLIHGGGGGVGHVAIQIAKALGAHVIAAASGSKREFVEGFGADEVIDYTAVDFAEAVRDIDVVLDTIGGDTAARSLGVLRPGGHLVTAVAEEDSELAAEFAAAGVRFSGIAVDPDPVALRGLVELVEQGRLRVHVQEVFPFERVADAHRLLDGGHLRGKLVLDTARRAT